MIGTGRPTPAATEATNQLLATPARCRANEPVLLVLRHTGAPPSPAASDDASAAWQTWNDALTGGAARRHSHQRRQRRQLGHERNLGRLRRPRVHDGRWRRCAWRSTTATRRWSIKTAGRRRGPTLSRICGGAAIVDRPGSGGQASRLAAICQSISCRRMTRWTVRSTILGRDRQFRAAFRGEELATLADDRSGGSALGRNPATRPRSCVRRRGGSNCIHDAAALRSAIVRVASDVCGGANCSAAVVSCHGSVPGLFHPELASGRAWSMAER